MTADQFDVAKLFTDLQSRYELLEIQYDEFVAAQQPLYALSRLIAEHFAACVAVESIRGTVLTTTTNWEMAFSDAVMKRNDAYRAVLDHIATKPQEGGE